MKKRASKIDWAQHFPPGFEWQHEKGLFTVFLSFAAGWAIIGYFSRLSTELEELEKGYDMAYFYDVLGNAFSWFPIVIAVMLLTIVIHYAHHHSGSKSIYLMRRLPDKWELHRRCITAPAVSALVALLVAVILFFIFYAAYMILMPEVCLKPGQLEQLLKNWSVM